MTVCLAALCKMGKGVVIIGASDRMITAADVEFEPPQSKIFQLTASIAVMTSDDSATHTELLQCVSAIVEARVAIEPQNWWRVKDVADLYADHYSKLRRQIVAREILGPLNLDADTFISRQHEMQPAFIQQVANEMYSHRVPHIGAIITGIDLTGAHIYVVYDERVICADNAGFAAIGAGGRHAGSHFMFAGHTPNKPYAETMLETYIAKKRAEVAPGVGGATDMFLIGPPLGSYRSGDVLVPMLDLLYQDFLKETEKASNKAEEQIREIYKAVTTATTQKQSAPEDGGETPADQKELRGGSEAEQPENNSGSE